MRPHEPILSLFISTFVHSFFFFCSGFRTMIFALLLRHPPNLYVRLDVSISVSKFTCPVMLDEVSDTLLMRPFSICANTQFYCSEMKWFVVGHREMPTIILFTYFYPLNHNDGSRTQRFDHFSFWLFDITLKCHNSVAVNTYFWSIIAAEDQLFMESNTSGGFTIDDICAYGIPKSCHMYLFMNRWE